MRLQALSSDESKSLDNESDDFCFLLLRQFFVLLRFFLTDLLQLLIFNELDFLMMSLKMMGLDPGLLVHALLLYAMINLLVVLENPLVVFVAWGLDFFPQQESSQLVTFFHWSCLYQKESSPKVVDLYKYFAAQNLDSPS